MTYLVDPSKKNVDINYDTRVKLSDICIVFDRVCKVVAC